MLSISSEDFSRSATSEFPNTLWNLKYHLCVQNMSTDRYPEPDQSNTYHNIITFYRPTNLQVDLMVSMLLLLKLNYGFLLHSIFATCLSHLIFPDLTVLIVFDENFNLWSSSLCNYLQPPITISLLGTNNFPSVLF
jgi:hypothetical protein